MTPTTPERLDEGTSDSTLEIRHSLWRLDRKDWWFWWNADHAAVSVAPILQCEWAAMNFWSRSQSVRQQQMSDIARAFFAIMALTTLLLAWLFTPVISRMNERLLQGDWLALVAQ